MTSHEVLRRLTAVEREQAALLKDDPMMWSVTHNWPSIRDSLECAGLIKSIAPAKIDGWVHPMTVITDLGREVRAIARAADEAALLADGNAWYSEAQKAEF